jgi:hypothetical protein
LTLVESVMAKATANAPLVISLRPTKPWLISFVADSRSPRERLQVADSARFSIPEVLPSSSSLHRHTYASLGCMGRSSVSTDNAQLTTVSHSTGPPEAHEVGSRCESNLSILWHSPSCPSGHPTHDSIPPQPCSHFAFQDCRFIPLHRADLPPKNGATFNVNLTPLIWPPRLNPNPVGRTKLVSPPGNAVPRL